MSKYIEVTVTRTRTITEQATLDISEDSLKGLDNDDLASIASDHGLWTEVDSVVSNIASEPTGAEDDSYDDMDDEAQELKERQDAWEWQNDIALDRAKEGE